LRNTLTDAVNVLVFFDTVLRPFGIKGKLLGFAFLLNAGNRNKIRTDSTGLDYIIRYPIFRETEMLRRLYVRRIQYRVLDNYLLGYDLPPNSCALKKLTISYTYMYIQVNKIKAHCDLLNPKST
jgi:hypothetical protein